MRRTISVLLGLTALCSFLVAQSGAQSAKPAPGCAGVAATDPNNDAISDPIGAPGGVTAGPANPNMEITRIWFDRSGSKTTANIEVKKLDKTVPDTATGVSWYFVWTSDVQHFVDAASDGSAVTYQYGDINAAGQYGSSGDTTGSFVEGDLGVVSIVIPNDIGGKVGTKLTEPYAIAYENLDIPNVGSALSNDDRAPDDGGGKAWTVADCDTAGGGGGGGGETPSPTPTASATPTTTPPPSSGGGGGGNTATPVQSNALNVKAGSALGSAKKASKSKRATVKLTGSATKIDAILYKGNLAKPKTYGKGKIAKVSGKAKLKLKITKKLKKGGYLLTLIGTNPDGQRAARTFKVKFKK